VGKRILALLLLASAVIRIGPEATAAEPAPPGASSCSGCHAPAINTAIPSLRGLAADQIGAAMLAFRSGQRSATVMDRIARGFSEQEIAAIAAWLGQRGG
jgi:cytochrome subunit of sulfide dehydrogenase